MCLIPSTTAATAAISNNGSNGTVIAVTLAPIVRPARILVTRVGIPIVMAGIAIVIAGAETARAKVKSPPSKAMIAANSPGPTLWQELDSASSS